MNINVTRDVITDLLPAYLSGEASAETKNLVETFMKGDPEFARLVKTESKIVFTNHVHGPDSDAELRTLEMTKKRMHRHHWHLGLAIAFTALACSFSFGPEGVRWLWKDALPIGISLATIAGILWIRHFHHGHSLRQTGL